MNAVLRYGEWLVPAALTFGPVCTAMFPGQLGWSFLAALGLMWLYLSTVTQRRRVEELARELERVRREASPGE